MQEYYQPVLNHSIVYWLDSLYHRWASRTFITWAVSITTCSLRSTIPFPCRRIRILLFQTNVPQSKTLRVTFATAPVMPLQFRLRMPLFMYLLGKTKERPWSVTSSWLHFWCRFCSGMIAGLYSQKPLNSVQVKDVLVELDIQYFRGPTCNGLCWLGRTHPAFGLFHPDST